METQFTSYLDVLVLELVNDSINPPKISIAERETVIKLEKEILTYLKSQYDGEISEAIRGVDLYVIERLKAEARFAARIFPGDSYETHLSQLRQCFADGRINEVAIRKDNDFKTDGSSSYRFNESYDRGLQLR